MSMNAEEILRTLMNSRDRISAAAWLVVRDTQTAEDIFQNVALKAMTKDVTFEVEGAVLSWAFITARREGIDWLRRRKVETTALDHEVLNMLQADWLEDVESEDHRMEALRACVKNMPTKSRTLLRLRYSDGYACKEVATRLNAGLNAIYKRLSRLHQALKDCVELRVNGARNEKSRT